MFPIFKLIVEFIASIMFGSWEFSMRSYGSYKVNLYLLCQFWKPVFIEHLLIIQGIIQLTKVLLKMIPDNTTSDTIPHALMW